MSSKQKHLDYIFSWGKHRGKTLRHVIRNDMQWIDWALENVSWFDFTPEAEEFYQEWKLDL